MLHPLPRAAVPASDALAFNAPSTVVLVRPVFLAICDALTPIRDSWWYASASSASVRAARWMFSTTCVTIRSASSGDCDDHDRDQGPGGFDSGAGPALTHQHVHCPVVLAVGDHRFHARRVP